ncbi:hypothetical protein [Lacrimispora sp.]|uniref:hypothetical protein n=1 Tax=Lacrimispora sp. TaxID=2719234 RepID=UPI0028A1CAB8|nr:hypothetical protein [Lacrimispora sp.]
MAVREEDLGSVIGPQGPQGIQGEVGPTGAKGDKGEDGSKWLTGTSAPSTQGVNGDYYLNTSNWDVYQKASGTWSKTGNIKGATGSKGDTGATGVTGAQGPKGDPFAIAKTYTSISAMNSGFASDGVGQGQFVVIDTGNVEDADNAKLYLKGASAYTYITDMSGATGLTGPQGPKGATGATGSTGPKGDQGVSPTFELRSGHLFAIYPE